MKAKNDLFSTEEKELALLAKALSHPARIKILKVLLEKKNCVCGQIVDLLPLAQSTVSQHLSELTNAGRIKGEIEGPKTCYCLNEETLEKAKSAFTGLFAQVCSC